MNQITTAEDLGLELRLSLGPQSMNQLGYEVMPGTTLGVFKINGRLFQSEWFGTIDAIVAAATALRLDPRVSAVAVLINSPGGEMIGMDDAIAAVRKLAQTKAVHPIAVGVCASNAYRLAAACGSEIAALPGALVGSLGVMWNGLDTSKAAEMEGVTPVVSTDAPLKAAGLYGVPFTDEMKSAFDAITGEQSAAFYAEIASARGITADAVRALQGGIFTAATAKTHRLVDRIVGSTDEFLRDLSTRYPAGALPAMTGPVGRIGATAMSTTAEAPQGTATATASQVNPSAAPATFAFLNANFAEDPKFIVTAQQQGLTESAAWAEYAKLMRERLAAATANTGTPAASAEIRGAEPSVTNPRGAAPKPQAKANALSLTGYAKFMNLADQIGPEKALAQLSASGEFALGPIPCASRGPAEAEAEVSVV